LRYLFLGDSVTFGYGIADYQNTIPPLVESHLNTHSPNPIQCINAGIGGYSPWQEYLFLQKEGLKYQPDIVVLSFILNDVTEKTRLITFGGADEGFQLSRNVNSLLDRLNFYFFLKRYIIPTLIYGVQVQQGAVQKDLQYGESLVYEADSPKIQEMWDITFHNLYQIQTLCRKHNILFCIVMYPYAFQIFEASLMNDPQKQVKDFCKQHSIPFLDLLPPLSQRIIETDADLDGYFLDTNHPNAQCNRVIARWVADFLRNEVLVTE
jgi:lysophospholipase L1-like esterase